MNPHHVILALMLVITGSLNTLFTKWTDLSEACGVYDCTHGTRKFNHPFVQAFTMFIGEFLCFIGYFTWYFIRRWKRRHEEGPDNEAQLLPFKKWFLFLPPALCDMLGTSTIYIGLNLTYASSFQMLRGSVILFTGLLSVAFLGRSISNHMWIGMGAITAGLVCVGVSDIIFNTNGDVSESDLNGIIAGDLLIILAQIIAATQVVIEEKFLKKHDVPTPLAVGLEGLFGMVIIGVLLGPMYYIPASKPFTTDPEGRLENIVDAFTMMGQNWHIMVGVIGGILSIALFNFSGFSITKEVSGTSRMVLDSARTLIIWVVSLALLWQPFSYKSFLLQLVGFALLFIGMCIYNDMIFAPFLRRHNLLTDSTSSGDSFDHLPADDNVLNPADQDVEQSRRLDGETASSSDRAPLIS